MKIALVGTGKTGQAIEAMARDRGHDVVARFNSGHPFLDIDANNALRTIDVFIDFSRPELALDHIRRYTELKLNAVIGTTGWYDEIDQVRSWMQGQDGAILYAPNFSIGVALVSRLAEAAAAMIDGLPEYDVSVHETHHRMKLDSPSGTALHLAQILLDKLSRKKRLETETQHQTIAADALHVSSARTGHVIGDHTISLDSPFDLIEISHHAKNRDGFAFGALRAAEWLKGKTGLFTLDDLLADWLG